MEKREAMKIVFERCMKLSEEAMKMYDSEQSVEMKMLFLGQASAFERAATEVLLGMGV